MINDIARLALLEKVANSNIEVMVSDKPEAVAYAMGWGDVIQAAANTWCGERASDE